ncbi:dihydrodipicolinate synthase family protein [Chengkuizengella sp. SCS-71B]|uniref:dihydrodipicolinate synthase family protein n=1 Tax=Chengkuizengella sp. SCS-71B TaxID=3115290 RepID=UPI0032C2474E
MKQFEGVFVAIVTPFTKNNEVDYSGLRDHCDWLIREGVHGLIPAGSVGEYAALTKEERAKVVETVIETAAGRVSVVVGTGAPSTDQVVYWVQHAKDAGAAGVMALPPINYNPSESEIIAHYEAISNVGLPIIAYNNPHDYKTDLTPELLGKLSKIKNVVAVKEFSGDIRRVQDIYASADLEILIGVDDLGFEGPLMGTTGWIAGFANALPKESVKIFELGRQGKTEEALPLYRKLLPLFHYDARPELVQAIKYTLELAGRPGGPTRPPRLPLSSSDLKLIKEAYELAISKDEVKI